MTILHDFDQATAPECSGYVIDGKPLPELSDGEWVKYTTKLAPGVELSTVRETAMDQIAKLWTSRFFVHKGK